MSKYALCVGINYPGTDGELAGCVNDALALRDFLVDRCAFPPENVVVLRDDIQGAPAETLPTHANLLAQLGALLRRAVAGDRIFFSFSGHGGQSQYYRWRQREVDGRNEFLYPSDHAVSGTILDNTLYGMLRTELADGVTATIVTDACHSGSAWDLAHNAAPVQFRVATHQEPHEHVAMRQKDVLVLSGCIDQQTSADAWFGADVGSFGAMTHSLLQCLGMCPEVTLKYLLLFLKVVLHERSFAQSPQMSSSCPFEKERLRDVFMRRLR